MIAGAKKLTKMAKKWRKFTAIRRGRVLLSRNESRCGSSDSCRTSQVVKKGHFVVYSSDKRRFVVPLAYLDNTVFRQLLRMSEEEYGLKSDGPIMLPFDSQLMNYFISLIQKNRDRDLHEDLIESVASSCCSSSRLDKVQMNQNLLVY